MAIPKVTIAGNQNYACILCGRCCRRFHVLITEEEIRRLQALRWGDEPDVPEDFVTRIHGHAYFRRRSSGACVFLDEQSGACRMHARFGLRVKALTCRGYPHNIASTWPGEVSVVARLDCPAVQRNAGPPLTSNRDAIEQLVRELGTRGGFTPHVLEGLSREAVETMTAALVGVISGEEEGTSLRPGARAWAFMLAVERLQALGTSFLNDGPTLKEVLPSLVGRVREEAAGGKPPRLGPFSRGLYREWLAAYCRRDEEMVRPGLLVRCRRALALGGYFFGWGSLAIMGMEHPDISFRRAGVPAGSVPREGSPHEIWDCWRRLVISRLEGPQFFGVAYYDLPFFTGLRALAQSYGLILGAARCHAAVRSSAGIEEQDVQYAVGAVDHCLGRSPLLQFHAWRRVESYFSGRRYGALLRTLGWD